MDSDLIEPDDIMYGVVDKEVAEDKAVFTLNIYGEKVPVVVMPEIRYKDEEDSSRLAAYMPASNIIMLTPYAFRDVYFLLNTLIHEATHAHGYLIGLREFMSENEDLVMLIGSLMAYLLIHNRDLFMLILNSFDSVVTKAMEKMEELESVGEKEYDIDDDSEDSDEEV